MDESRLEKKESRAEKPKRERKRVMTPAIDGMTVRKERACLSEIRSLSPDITYLHVLSNGWTAGEFALRYVTGHHRKRKSKTQREEQEGQEEPTEKKGTKIIT